MLACYGYLLAFVQAADPGTVHDALGSNQGEGCSNLNRFKMFNPSLYLFALAMKRSGEG